MFHRSVANQVDNMPATAIKNINPMKLIHNPAIAMPRGLRKTPIAEKSIPKNQRTQPKIGIQENVN